MMLWNVRRHRHRASDLRSTAFKSQEYEQQTVKNGEASADEADAPPETIRNWLVGAEAARQYGDYPDKLKDTMPTRLGNVLRRYELLAGRHYGLESIATAPRILQVADARDVAYVHNQRMQMELALRTSVLALAATIITVMFMWQHGPWLLLALAPYIVAYATYRGAVVVAREYGTALTVLIDLNRFDLYSRMHLRLPDDLKEERENNGRLTEILRLDNVELAKRTRRAYLKYVHPGQAAPEAKDEHTDKSDEPGSETSP
jgi:hypothetical protein